MSTPEEKKKAAEAVQRRVAELERHMRSLEQMTAPAAGGAPHEAGTRMASLEAGIKAGDIAHRRDTHDASTHAASAHAASTRAPHVPERGSLKRT